MIPQEVLSSISSDPIQKWREVTLPFGTEMPGLVAFYCRDLLPPTASIAIQIVDSKSFAIPSYYFTYHNSYSAKQTSNRFHHPTQLSIPVHWTDKSKVRLKLDYLMITKFNLTRNFSMYWHQLLSMADWQQVPPGNSGYQYLWPDFCEERIIHN